MANLSAPVRRSQAKRTCSAVSKAEGEIAFAKAIPKLARSMLAQIRLLSTDFDGTLVAHGSDPVLDRECMQAIKEFQDAGAIWAINTGRSVDLLESGLIDFAFPFRPDFILTSERDIFRPAENGGAWEAYGDWNARCARDHSELFSSASSVLAEVIDFVNQKTKARVIYEGNGPAGLIAESEEEMDLVTRFIDEARSPQPKFNYQRNTVYLRFCHADYHKGAALAELSRLLEIPREQIFAAGDHHNDISMLDGRYAALVACPANAIPAVKAAVRDAGGYVAKKEYGAGVYEALLHFAES
jgi:HAD superfamily hydrolase (TIGR01484 family)